MGAPAVSSFRKIVAAMMAFALAFSMVPVAWADDAPAGTLAGSVAGGASDDEAAEPMVAEGTDGEASESNVQSAGTKTADGSSGGTTISIAVYRSSFPIVKWDLNDDDYGLTKAKWAWSDRTGELPKDASPGSEVSWPESGRPADYEEPTRDGFEFAGWSIDKSASAGGFIDGSSPALSMPEGAPEAKSYTLYALWTPLEYSVIFELSKNPGSGKGPGSDASYELNWESDSGVSRIVTYLGEGRYQVDGFTMDERTYDAVTRTVGLPEPSRTGYRFLGWSEPNGQSLAIDNAAKDGFALNPVRLTQIDGTPVLTARWTSAFGVTAPLSITFGDYDKTGAPGNPWLGDKGSNAADDTTQSEADDTTKSEQEGYEALGQAYFENTGWHEAVKVVGLTSERYASANQVLTTYDSKLASEAAVLGDGTEANPGERLLSLYPSAYAPADKSSGIHFRLTDALDETALGSSFTMAPQGEEGAKKEISYGLNLSTDPTDGSANHGLVLPTNDYERKQIATVSYTFATATAANEDPVPETFWTYDDDRRMMGVKEVKQDALAIATGNQATIEKYTRWMNEDHRFYVRWFDKGVTEAAASNNTDWTVYDVRIIGINHDTLASGAGKAGVTFQFVDLLTAPAYMNSSTNTNAGGWASTSLRASLNGGEIWRQAPISLRGTSQGGGAIALVSKTYRNGGNQSGVRVASIADTIFVTSYPEMVSVCQPGLNSVWSTLANDGSSLYAWWKAQAISGTSQATYLPIVKTLGSDGAVCNYWTRSAYPSNATNFVHIYRMYTPTDTSNRALSAAGVCPTFCL